MVKKLKLKNKYIYTHLIPHNRPQLHQNDRAWILLPNKSKPSDPMDSAYRKIFYIRPPGGTVRTWQCASSMAVQGGGGGGERKEERCRQSLPVSESRSSVRGGLVVKESLRFMEDLAFPSFPSNSLRSSFGVLVKGDNLSLLCQRPGGRDKTG